MVYPVVVIVMPVPTLAEAKVKTGDPPRNTSSPASTPTSVAVPEALAAVVSSYILSLPLKPVIVKEINPAVVTSNFVGLPCRLGDPSSSLATTYTS